VLPFNNWGAGDPLYAFREGLMSFDNDGRRSPCGSGGRKESNKAL